MTQNSISSRTIFKAISNFVIALSDISNNHHLHLYKGLITRTKINEHSVVIDKYISGFTSFCTKNNDAIINKDKTKIVEPKISYSLKVFMDIPLIMSNLDNKTTDTVWNHLLYISSLVYPEGGAKEKIQDTNSINSRISSSLGDSKRKIH